jgi:hypothetical protein
MNRSEGLAQFGVAASIYARFRMSRTSGSAEQLASDWL